MSLDPKPAEPVRDEEETDSDRRMDGELKTMGAILRLLDKQSEAARARIVTYIHARHAEGRGA